MEEIKKYFEKNVLLTDSDWQIFSSKLFRREFSKKTKILKIGQKENHLSFIEKGIIRFCIPSEFDDLTFGFAFANNFVSAYDIFLTQTSSTYELETITNTVLWSVTYEDLQDIYAQTKIGEKIGRLASEELFLKKSKRELSLLNDTPQQRYLNLFTEQPHLLQLIPLKYIASYIGITSQALSRIRKRIS
ncbi:Crp/Fnr family transcriptional regulator [Flavobacterium marginilacus]|uniref:Crp/Fnr family transcriptional regulator n=1 Tax=Flavobacterium marginilacus TaxID=3003256 RepID=UPI00248D8A68|nr:cyclic nucleotide-binding domain-containing protein [Flavobacterium marginilacus]